MQDSNEHVDTQETEEPESDTEGHSMFLYEGARHMSRQHEHDAQRAGRDARLLKERKDQKGR